MEYDMRFFKKKKKPQFRYRFDVRHSTSVAFFSLVKKNVAFVQLRESNHVLFSKLLKQPHVFDVVYDQKVKCVRTNEQVAFVSTKMQ